MTDWNWLGLPLKASKHAARLDSFNELVHVILIAGFIFWMTWFVIALLKFSRKKNPKADYHGIKSNWPYIPIAIMAIFDFVLLFGLSMPYWHDQINTIPTPGDDAIEIRVIAQQFEWNIHYPGKDGIFGRTDPTLIDDQFNALGLDRDDPNGERCFEQNHAPSGQPASVNLPELQGHDTQFQYARISRQAGRYPGNAHPNLFHADDDLSRIRHCIQ